MTHRLHIVATLDASVWRIEYWLPAYVVGGVLTAVAKRRLWSYGGHDEPPVSTRHHLCVFVFWPVFVLIGALIAWSIIGQRTDGPGRRTIATDFMDGLKLWMIWFAMLAAGIVPVMFLVSLIKLIVRMAG